MVYSRTETITYDEYGVPTSITDFDGNTTTFVLDDHGNVLEEEQPGGVDQEWTYNSAGQVLTYTDGNGATTTYTYNDLGRLTEIEEPGAGSPTIEYGYDSAGDVTSVTDEVGDTVTYTYNRWAKSSPSKTRCRPPRARTCRSATTPTAIC